MKTIVIGIMSLLLGVFLGMKIVHFAHVDEGLVGVAILLFAMILLLLFVLVGSKNPTMYNPDDQSEE